MKSAEEHENEWCSDFVKHERIAGIRLIQIDALKHAAEIAKKEGQRAAYHAIMSDVVILQSKGFL